MKRRILLIYTGGTIGMMKKYGSEVLIPFDFSNIINHIPEIKLINANIDFYEFENPIDSSDIEIKDWKFLALLLKEKYEYYDGFVVLHGTDTMSYTASMMSFMLQGIKKPVIFTGSQLPIGELRTDSKENLITSIYYASLYQNSQSVIQEVCLYFEHKLYRANRTTKFSSEHFDAFISPNYPILGESGVNLEIFNENLFKPSSKFNLNTDIEPNIDVVSFFPGRNKRLLEYSLLNSEIKGLILRTFGSGNIPSDKETIDYLKKAKDLGKEIVVITQCVRGSVSIGKYHNSTIFTDLNVCNGFDITLEAATTKLMWLLGQKYKSEDLKKEFESQIAGEISVY
ncbi:asparaginase [Apibacter sp. HY039]|uniref:asparaginase n=1 Tax=Apibacter sp. HY039 TaxID=2501476 RepID=UPI000FEBB473|nr:asparaginase [Apibacter sp. HY039]